MMQARPKALFWDNDGVLVETEQLFFQACLEIFAEHDVDITEALYVELTMRQGRGFFHLLAERGASPEDIVRIRATRDARYSELLSEGVRVLPGVRDALEALHGVIPMAVVTSSGREHFEQIHEPLGLLGYFDFVLASGDYKRSKPAPDPYLEAAERLGVPPSACVVVEDSERGVQAATAAGMHCIAVPSGFSVGGNFANAHHVLDRADEIPAVLAGLAGR